MSTIGIEFIPNHAGFDRRAAGIPDSATFAIVEREPGKSGVTLRGFDHDVEAGDFPVSYAKRLAEAEAKTYVDPPKGMWFGYEGRWFAYRIRRGGGTGRGRRSTQPAIVFRQTAVAA